MNGLHDVILHESQLHLKQYAKSIIKIYKIIIN